MRRVLWLVMPAVIGLSACMGEDSSKVPADLQKCGTEEARCSSGPMFVLNTLDLVYEDEDGHVDGFNLDGVVSDGNSPNDCLYEDFTSSDGTPGIDNQLTNLIGSFPDEIREALPLLLQNAIGTGGLLLIGELVGVDDWTNDDQVGLVFRQSEDIPLVGTDDLILAGQTFKLAANHFSGAYRDGYIENGRLYAGPFDLDLKIQVFGVHYFLTFRNVLMDLKVNKDGEVTEGLFGGGVHLDDIDRMAETIVVEDLGELVKALVPPFADIRSPDSDKCDIISGGLQLTAIEAFVFNEVITSGTDGPITGPDVFSKAGCIGCHTVSEIPGARQTNGPSLDGLGDRAGVTDGGKSADEYIRQAILNPDAYIVDGYEDGVMPDDTRADMSTEEFETLVSWLLTL